MTDDWDDGYEESLDEGHDFAEKVLGRIPPEYEWTDFGLVEVVGGKGMVIDKAKGEQLDTGVVAAIRVGICTVCKDPIEVNDPIKSATKGGWRHAGCSGEQKFVNKYQQEKKLRDDFLEGKRRSDDDFTDEF